MPNNQDNKFSTAQFDDAYPDGVESSYWSLARVWIIGDVLEESRTLVGGLAASQILDIGCGRGIVVRALRAAGADVRGCEVGSPRIAPEIAGYVYTSCDYKDLPAAVSGTIDTVLLLDVIEHMEDPIAFLSELRRYLPKLKRLIVTVPARPELWSNYDQYYGHYRRYDKQELKRTLSGAGFSLHICRYFFRSLYIPARLVIRLQGRREVELTAPKNLRAHRWIARFFLAEYRLLKAVGVVPGTSLIAVAELKVESEA